MLRAQRLSLGGRDLVYFDAGGDGDGLLALHGHFGRARTFDQLAAALSSEWRVVALEQRGHGLSSPADDYDRAGYVADAAHAVETLGLAPTVVLGHSLGGINAYQLAARRPDLVRAVIVEDAPAVIEPRPDLFTDLPRRFTSLRALREAVDDHAGLLESAFEDDDGWGFRFDAAARATSCGATTPARWRPAGGTRGSSSSRASGMTSTTMSSRATWRPCRRFLGRCSAGERQLRLGRAAEGAFRPNFSASSPAWGETHVIGAKVPNRCAQAPRLGRNAHAGVPAALPSRS
jgi:esterase